MKRYLLDTNVLLHLNNSYMGWESIARKIADAESGTILLSAATVFEIARMEERGKFKKKVVRACVEMLSIFPIEPITPEIASISGTIHGWFMNNGIVVSDCDAMNCGIAIAKKYILVTDDTKLHQAPSLIAENWVRSGY